MGHLCVIILLCQAVLASVTAYPGLSSDDLIKCMLRQRTYNSIDHYHSSGQPQPHVTCTGATCTYAFTVSAANEVSGKCNSSTEEINTKITDLSNKLDQVLTTMEQKNEVRELEVLQHQMAALQNQLQSERIRRNKLEIQLKGQARTIHKYRQGCRKNDTRPPVMHDCQDIYEYVSRRHGVFEIQPKNGHKMSVFCEDGWTVFQHREDGTVDFDRNWEEYKHGFGKLTSEHWLGNENLYHLTRQKPYKLMVELGDWEGRVANAIYESFKIDNEVGLYRLKIGKFVAGKGRDGLRFHENIGHGGSVNGMAFSTRDMDNDLSSRNCAELYRGGWWYNDCFWSNLNGDYVYKGGVFSDKFTWFPWKMNHYSLKTSKMKLKPT